MEKIKKYLNEISSDGYYNSLNHLSTNNQKKDEDAFDKMTNIIEGIRREEEIIYCDLGPAKEKLAMIGSEKENESAKRISNVIQKIENLQAQVNYDPNLLIKREVEEIHGMIKSMPDESERKLFKDSLIDSDRLYDVFLPLTTLLMIIT